MNNLTKSDSIHNGALNSHTYSSNSNILHYPSTSRTSPAMGMRTISPSTKYVIHPQQVQSQWQNLITSPNNVATTINNQMYHPHQMQIQRQFFYHNGQPVTQINSQVNGFLPSTSTTNHLNGINGTKKVAMKRKNSQQNINDDLQRTVKKPGYIAVNGISSQNQMIYQHGNQTYCLQPAKFSSSPSTNNSQQQFSPFASYDHQDLIHSNINYQQQWNTSNAKQINPNSEMVRMELRNSVQARQNSPLHSSLIQQQNENNYRCNPTINSIRINQQQVMSANFVSMNNNYNNNTLKLGSNEHFDQQFFQQQIQNQQLQHQHQNQQRQQDQQKNFFNQRNVSEENCSTILTYVDLDDFDLSELYDFNLLNDNNGFDLDNAETQKLVQMWLS